MSLQVTELQYTTKTINLKQPGVSVRIIYAWRLKSVFFLLLVLPSLRRIKSLLWHSETPNPLRQCLMLPRGCCKTRYHRRFGKEIIKSHRKQLKYLIGWYDCKHNVVEASDKMERSIGLIFMHTIHLAVLWKLSNVFLRFRQNLFHYTHCSSSEICFKLRFLLCLYFEHINPTKVNTTS